MIWVGKVVDIKDYNDGGRIRVRLKNADKYVSKTEDIPYAYPLMPFFLHVEPKVDEGVIILCQDDDPSLQRFYIGPVISQPQKMYLDFFETGAFKLLGGNGAPPEKAVSNIPEAQGAFASKDEVAVYGRKNTDLIFGDNDVRLRCGARLLGNAATTDVEFNRSNPSYLKLTYHETPIKAEKKEWNSATGAFEDSGTETDVESTANVIAQEINLISTNGDPYINVTNTNKNKKGQEGISDEELKKIIENLHPAVYGDKLLELLYKLVVAFKNHTHKYSQMKPVQDFTYKELDKFDMSTLLSKNIRLN